MQFLSKLDTIRRKEIKQYLIAFVILISCFILSFIIGEIFPSDIPGELRFLLGIACLVAIGGGTYLIKQIVAGDL
jgi:hypothetical protein